MSCDDETNAIFKLYSNLWPFFYVDLLWYYNDEKNYIDDSTTDNTLCRMRIYALPDHLRRPMKIHVWPDLLAPCWRFLVTLSSVFRNQHNCLINRFLWELKPGPPIMFNLQEMCNPFFHLTFERQRKVMPLPFFSTTFQILCLGWSHSGLRCTPLDREAASHPLSSTTKLNDGFASGWWSFRGVSLLPPLLFRLALWCDGPIREPRTFWWLLSWQKTALH